MPLPDPNLGETSDEWMDRCMSNPTMNAEYPENDQRAAICHQKWRDAHSSVSFSAYSSGKVRIKLMPVGYITSTKGDFILDAESWKLVAMKLKKRKPRMVIDYEHQSQGGSWSSPDGKAPAAGWIESLEFVDGDGLYGSVEWTPKARQMILDGEYRYLSPVLVKRKTDNKMLELLSFALTNTPAIDEMDRVAANRRSEAVQRNTVIVGAEHGDEAMMSALERLKIMLADAGWIDGSEPWEKVIDVAAAKAAEAVTGDKLNSGDDEMATDKKPDKAPEAPKPDEAIATVAAKLGLAKDATVEVVCKALDERMVTTVAAADYQTLKQRCDSLEKSQKDRDAVALVDKYVASGQVNPNDAEQLTWALGAAAADPKAFELLIAKAPKLWVAGAITTVGGAPPDDRSRIILAAKSEFNAQKHARLKGCDLVAFVNGSLLYDKQPALDKEEIATLTVAK